MNITLVDRPAFGSATSKEAHDIVNKINKDAKGFAQRVRDQLKQVGKSARQASKEAGLSPDYLSNYMRGKASVPNAQNLEAIAEALRCHPLWLLYGKKPTAAVANYNQTVKVLPHMPVDLPILGGAVGGTSAFFADNGQPLGMTGRPAILENIKSAYAVYVTGESMEPRYFGGEIVHVHPYKPVRRGDFVVIQTMKEDGERSYFVKQFVKNDDKTGEVVCRQFNPANDDFRISKVELVAIHVIVGTATE